MGTNGNRSRVATILMGAGLVGWMGACATAAETDEGDANSAGFQGLANAGTLSAGVGGGAGMAAGTLAPAGTGAVAGTGVQVADSAGVGGAAGVGAAGATAGVDGLAGMTGAAGTLGGTGAAGTGPVAGTGGDAMLPMLMGPTPTLPAIQGECPELVDGSTISIAGHGGVLLSVGPPNKGGALLFYWHGTGGSAQEALRSVPANVRNEIISTGGIIASFNGRDSSGTAGDCSGTAAHNIADFNAADQIAACAVRDHGIDPRRIYTTGCSAGGLQSGCMAQQRSSYLAAAAPNSGGVVFSQPWQDAHSPAIFTMHGGSSDVVIVTFSQTSATLDMSAKSHGSFVVNCNHGGGHCQAPADLKTASWEFMKDHYWGFTDSPWQAAIPGGTPDYCAIY